VLEASFIVIAYNAVATLEPTLRSISALEGVGSYEIVVVDDGSHDGTSELVHRYAATDPRTRLIQLGINHGRGAARAAGVEHAGGEWIATVDSDIQLPPHWYTRCRQALEEADAVAGIPMPDGDVQYVFSRFGLRPRPLPSMTAITGNNALYRRAVFALVAYDPALRNGEDVALSEAMRAHGLRMRTIEDLHVHHEEVKGFRGSVAWLYESGVGSSRQLRRYRRLRQADLAFVLWCLTWLAPLRMRRLRRPLRYLAPIWFTTLIGFAHTRNKFYLRRVRPAKVALASIVNATLLFAYFAGRARGLLARGNAPGGSR
jgi:glycosyltransferase involved in cell wall biosynthesis